MKRAAATNTDWPLHKPSALEDLKQKPSSDLWRSEGNYVRKGPFPPPSPSLDIREGAREEDDDCRTYLQLTPLHCDRIVFESGDSEPTTASSPVPTTSKFEAKGLKYKFLAFDSKNTDRQSEVKSWTATLRLKKQLVDRGDHYEVELLAFPKANGVSINYTTDGSSPINANAAVYEGPIRVPENCRKVCAVAKAPMYSLTSQPIVQDIPKRGEEARTIDPTQPALWQKGASWMTPVRPESDHSTGANPKRCGVRRSANGHQQKRRTGCGLHRFTGNRIRRCRAQIDSDQTPRNRRRRIATNGSRRVGLSFWASAD